MDKYFIQAMLQLYSKTTEEEVEELLTRPQKLQEALVKTCNALSCQIAETEQQISKGKPLLQAIPQLTESADNFAAMQATLSAKPIPQIMQQMIHEHDPLFEIRGVGNDGMLIGFQKYELLDPQWSEAIFHWIANYYQQVAFVNKPQIIQIPNNVTFALFGDWGTGFHPQLETQLITEQINQVNADYAVHLGDVYYVGSKEAYEEHFLNILPKAKRGLFNLNSNHDMYCLAEAYFESLQNNPQLQLQKSCSFFALENDHWIVVGLDSAAFSDRISFYVDGAIDETQITFLRQIAEKQKPVIILSHHQPVNNETGEINKLYQQVYEPLKGLLKYWYCGHLHLSIAYRPISNTLVRICGHAGMPSGIPDWTHAAKEAKQFEWFNSTKSLLPNAYLDAIENHFVKIELNGPSIKEYMINSKGNVDWKSEN